MAFPEDPLGTQVELQIGGVWTDVTEHVLTRDIITHTRGRTGEGRQVDPASCTLTLRSPDGLFSPRNPRSPYYGLIGRNSPLRVSVHAGTPYLDLPGTADTATTPDHSSLDITGDIDLRWEGEADWYASGAQMLIGKWGAAGNRSYHLRLEAGFLYMSVSTDGTAGYTAWHRLPQGLPKRAALRGTMDADNGAGGITFRLYWAKSLDGPWTKISLDSLGTIPGSATIFTSSAPLLIAPEQPDATVPRAPVVGRCYRAEVRDGINGTVVAAPDFTAQQVGATSFTDSAGRTWTVAAGAITTRQVRFVGEYSDWPPRWGRTGALITVGGEASGILRRLTQGKKALDSTLRRRIPAYSPVAYWPMEEGPDATQVASPIPGVRPFTPVGFDFAADDSLPGSGPLPAIQPGASFSAKVPATTAGSWQVECVYLLPEMPVAQTTLLEVRTTGTARRVQVRVATNQVWIVGLDADGAEVFNHTTTAPQFTGTWNRLQVQAIQSGGDVQYVLRWIVIGGTGFVSSVTVPATPGYVTEVRSSFGAGLEMRLGHLAVFRGQVTAFNFADHGFSNEAAGTRLQRLGAEEGIPVWVTGDPSEQAAMGPQRPGSLLELLEQCEQADGGILVEDREALGLRYRGRATLYNQAPALVLSYRSRALGELEPIDDDSTVRNDVTVERASGSSARAVLEDGPLSVQAPPDGVGRYDDSARLNLASDSQAEPMAYWLLHLGTWDEPRYPTVTLRLHKAPELIPAVIGITEGDIIRITDLPEWLPPGPVDLMVQGYTERIGVRTWEIDLVCAPAGPYLVGVISGGAVVEDFEDTEYAVTITGGGSLPWTRTSAQSHSGSWSLRSGAISNNQASEAVVTVPPGATQLTFWYRTSSETAGPGFEGDRLTVHVDSTQVLRAQGETPWTVATVDVSSASTVTFRYSKDNSVSSGEDAVYIDDLVFTIPSAELALVDTDGSELMDPVTETDTTLSVAITDGPEWRFEAPFQVEVGGEVMTVTGITGVNPQDFTVIRSVTGVVKAHPAGTPLRLATPARVAL